MLHFILENPVRFILALLIGLATAWWIWGRWSSGRDEGSGDWGAGPSEPDAPTPPPPPRPPEPETAPELEPEPPVEPQAAGTAAGAAAVAAAAASAPPLDGPNIATAVGEPDDLKKIKGIGPKLEKLCNSLGVTRFDQIAAWTEADVAEVDPYLQSFRGRIARDDWVGQAKVLAEGGSTEFAERYDG